jgi:uncharacterized protein YhfF
MEQPDIQDYWQQYRQTCELQLAADHPYRVDQFGDSPVLADALGQLVLAGTKRATCSALWEWEAAQEPLPTVGDTTIVLDGANRPLCIIETTEVILCPFEQVDVQFAYDEGEDDLTLQSWRREHWRYFSRVLPTIGKQPTADMMLVCERFRVVYPPQY